MAHLLGLIVVLFSWLVPLPAQAAFPPTAVEQWCMAVQYGTSPRCVSGKTATHADYDTWIKTVANAYMGKCNGGLDAWTVSGQYYHTELVNTSTTVQHNYGSGGCDGSPGPYWNTSDAWKKAHQLTSTQQTCPANSTLQGGQCVCTAPMVQNATNDGCTAPNLCAELTGKSAGNYNLLVGANESRTGMKQLCITAVSSGDPAQPGCLATGEATFAWQNDGSTFTLGMAPGWYAQVSMAFTGAKCNPDPNGSTASGSPSGSGPVPGSGTEDGQASQCPVGKVPGQVNGQTICVTPGTDTPQQAKKETNETEQKADGTTVEKTTSKQTVCDATKCVTTTTTTTTTTPPGGTASTTTETSTSTCVVGSPDCSAKAGVGGAGGGGNGDGTDPSAFGGSCTQAFSCKGDAIMCAVSLEQHKRNCALFVDSSPESILYGNEKGKTGAQYTSENVTISSGSFNSSNAFGGAAQCIQDKTLTVWGTQVVLPFSNVCGTLAHLGTLLMTLSFLLAFRIVARG